MKTDASIIVFAIGAFAGLALIGWSSTASIVAVGFLAAADSKPLR